MSNKKTKMIGSYTAIVSALLIGQSVFAGPPGAVIVRPNSGVISTPKPGSFGRTMPRGNVNEKAGKFNLVPAPITITPADFGKISAIFDGTAPAAKDLAKFARQEMVSVSAQGTHAETPDSSRALGMSNETKLAAALTEGSENGKGLLEWLSEISSVEGGKTTVDSLYSNLSRLAEMLKNGEVPEGMEDLTAAQRAELYAHIDSAIKHILSADMTAKEAAKDLQYINDFLESGSAVTPETVAGLAVLAKITSEATALKGTANQGNHIAKSIIDRAGEKTLEELKNKGCLTPWAARALGLAA